MSGPAVRLAFGLAVALLLAACAANPPGRAGDSAPPGDAAGAEEATACGAVERTVDEGHHHLVGDAPPPTGYATEPPASGWHYRDRARVQPGVARPDDPLTEPEQVSVLAVGGVVVTYHRLPEDELRALAALVNRHSDRVALTPYDRLEPGHVALTAWRRIQRCAGYDEATVAAFIDRYAADELDYGMGGHPPGG